MGKPNLLSEALLHGGEKFDTISLMAPALLGLHDGQRRKRFKGCTKRRDICRNSIETFCTTYLSHHFLLPFGEQHYDLFKTIEEDKVEKKVARGEPREHGKSTIMLVAAPLWWMAFRMKWFILLLGAGKDALAPHFSALQQELDPNLGNEMLLFDFPHLKPQMDFKGQFVKWDVTTQVAPP